MRFLACHFLSVEIVLNLVSVLRDIGVPTLAVNAETTTSFLYNYNNTSISYSNTTTSGTTESVTQGPITSSGDTTSGLLTAITTTNNNVDFQNEQTTENTLTIDVTTAQLTDETTSDTATPISNHTTTQNTTTPISTNSTTQNTTVNTVADSTTTPFTANLTQDTTSNLTANSTIQSTAYTLVPNSTAQNTTTPFTADSTTQNTTTPLSVNLTTSTTTPSTIISDTTSAASLTSTTSTTPDTTTTSPPTTAPTTRPTTQNPITTTTGKDLCTPNPCLNSGTCREYTCACLPGYTGKLCENNTILASAISINFDRVLNSSSQVQEIMNSVELSLSEAPANDKSVALSSTATILTVATKILNVTMDTQTARNITTSIIDATSSIVRAMSQVTCTKNSLDPLCNKTQTTNSYTEMEESMFKVGQVLVSAKNKSSENLSTNEIHLVVDRISDISLASNRQIKVRNVVMKLPESLKDSEWKDSIISQIVMFNETFAKSLDAGTRFQPATEMVSIRITNSRGQKLDIDNTDLVDLTFNLPEEPDTLSLRHNLSNNAVFSIPLMECCQHGTLTIEFTLDGVDQFTLIIGTDPYLRLHQLRASVTSKNGLDVFKTRPVNADVRVVGDQLKVSMYNVASLGETLFARVTYMARRAQSSSRRRLLQSDPAPFMAMTSLSAIYLNKVCQCWVSDNKMQITNVDAGNQVRFTSNFLGSFSVSRFLIAPNMINFDKLFLNFSDKVESTPHVLALDCVLIFLTILVVIFLRRMDRKDSDDWTYLPLLGNRKNDSWHYAISVTTSPGSCRRLDAVPSFRLIGQYGQTRAVAIQDGIRDNFRKDTTNNFILSTSSHIGPLFELKIWLNKTRSELVKKPEKYSSNKPGIDISWWSRVRTNFRSSTRWHPVKPRCDWKVDHIAVMDLSTGERYTFVIRDWLSETQGGGRTYRHVPVLDPDMAEGAAIFSLISRKKLFDEHLWLSVTRRQTYSVFTRVQRFACAVSILFLTMVTNAMWYQTGSTTEESVDAGIELGSLRITFRIFQVGVLSSLIVMCPAVVMTYFFRRRRQWPILRAKVAPEVSTFESGFGDSERTSSVSEFQKGFTQKPYGTDIKIFLPARITKANDVYHVGDQFEPNSLKNCSYDLEESFYWKQSVDSCGHVEAAGSPMTNYLLEEHDDFEEDQSSFTYQMNKDMGLVGTDISSVLEQKFYNAENGGDNSQTKSEMSIDVADMVKTPDDAGDLKGFMSNKFTCQTISTTPSNVKDICQALKSKIPDDRKSFDSKNESFENSYAPDVNGVIIADSNVPKQYHYCPSPYRHTKTYSDSADLYEVHRHVAHVESKRHGVGIQMVTFERRWLLPWWSVFVGYAVVVLSIAVSASVTFFYSLEWGGEVTLQWMVSLFFATTSGTFLFEPIKILILTLALSCVFRDHAHEELSDMAPVNQFYSKYADTLPYKDGKAEQQQDEPMSSDVFSSEVAQQRTILKFQQRLSEISRTLAYHVAYIVLFCVLCLSTSVPTSYRQNKVLRRGFNWTRQGEPSNIQDIYQWLNDIVVPYGLPKTWSNGVPMNVYQQKFTSDLEMYRLTPMSLTQWRVKGECSIRKTIQDFVNKTMRCSPDYTDEMKETGSFLVGWVHCRTGCDRPEYVYTPGDQWALNQYGELAVYSPGGYKVLLAQERSNAFSIVNTLKSQNWLDRFTRAVLLELAVYNPNTRLFTQVKVLFELPSSGGVFSKVEVLSANLYPYTTAWDFLLLLTQIGFAVSILVRVCVLTHLLVCSAIRSQNRPQLSPDVAVEGLELVFSLTAVTYYTLRVVQTISLVEYINNNPKVSVSLDAIFAYDELYTLFISSIFFMRILRLLGPMSINSQLYIMRYTLIASTPVLLSIWLSMVLLLMAFASFFYIYDGPVHDDVKSVYTILTQLVNLLLAMAKSLNIDPDSKDVIKVRTYKIMSGIFTSLTTIFFFNFAISLLNLTLANLKSEELFYKTHSGNEVAGQAKGHGHRDDVDRRLGTFIWDKIGSFFHTRDDGHVEKAVEHG